MRNNLTPQDYIRQLFRETKDGKLSITYAPFIGKPETSTYQVNWTEVDVEEIVHRYNLLTFALARIGQLDDQLEDKAIRGKLLSVGDLEIWNTYICPYEPFECDLSIVEEIHERAQLGDLFEEEEELWKRYCIWREDQSRKRIPFNRRSSADMIQRARRYEKLISLHAPEIVVTEEGRCLAEEMVLYYAGKEEPIIWE
jgi:hypothetical protein